MAKKLTQKVLKYTAIFEPAEEGGYVVTVPALPGCISEGDTFEEAVKMIKDAMKGYLAVTRKEGLEIPISPTISNCNFSTNSHQRC